MRVRRSTLAEQLDDDALRAGASSALAFLRFNGGDADAPRLADRAHALAVASGDRSAAERAELCSPTFSSGPSYRCVRVTCWRLSPPAVARRDERAAATALWYLALVELRAGRWSQAEQYAERPTRSTSVRDLSPRSTCSRSRSSSPIAAISSAPGSWPRLGRELAEQGRRSPRRARGDRGRSSSIGTATQVRRRRGSPRARRRPMQPAGVSRTCAGGAPTTQRR